MTISEAAAVTKLLHNKINLPTAPTNSCHNFDLLHKVPHATIVRQSSGLKILGTEHPKIQHHIPGERRPELECCKSLETHKKPPQIIPVPRLPWLVFNVKLALRFRAHTPPHSLTPKATSVSCKGWYPSTFLHPALSIFYPSQWSCSVLWLQPKTSDT